MAGHEHHQAADGESEQGGQQRHDDAAAADVGGQPRGRRLGHAEVVRRQAHAAVRPLPPVIAKPSSSSDASGGNSPTICPS